MEKNKFALISIFYFLFSIFYLIYSYSQIDLNLTLSSNQIYQEIQRQLIQLGYFQRPLSALIYLSLIFLFFIFYFLFLNFVRTKKLNKKEIWFLILGTFLVLLFSYPAFSHDIFNYIFYPRVLIKYQKNPWVYNALDFPNDLWTRFMHSTHQACPYGAVWLLAIIFPYLLGFGKFVLTLFNFKLLLALSYLGSCFLIFKILCMKIPQRLSNAESLSALAFFAFNPLILTESLISPHIDIFMVFLGLLAIFLIFKKKQALGIVFLFFSIATKYITFGFLPFLLKKVKFEKKVLVACLLTFLAILVPIYLRELLPWYFIPLIALISLSNSNFLKIVSFGLCLGGNLYYLPYLYIGEYNNIVKTWRLYLFFLPILASFLVWLFVRRHPELDSGSNLYKS